MAAKGYNGCKLLLIAVNGWNGWMWLDMAENHWRWHEWLEMAGHCCIWLEKSGIVLHFWKLLDMAWNGWKWLEWVCLSPLPWGRDQPFWNGLKWLERSGIGWKWLEMVEMALDCQGWNRLMASCLGLCHVKWTLYGKKCPYKSLKANAILSALVLNITGCWRPSWAFSTGVHLPPKEECITCKALYAYFKCTILKRYFSVSDIGANSEQRNLRL